MFFSAVYIYERDGDSWDYVAKSTQSVEQNGENLGWSAAIDGDTVVVGARKADVGAETFAGAVYVYEKPLSGWANMTETAILTASDIKALDKFGNSVAILGDTIAIGSYYDDDNSYNYGSVYMYVKSGANWVDSSSEDAKL